MDNRIGYRRFTSRGGALLFYKGLRSRKPRSPAANPVSVDQLSDIRIREYLYAELAHLTVAAAINLVAKKMPPLRRRAAPVPDPLVEISRHHIGQFHRIGSVWFWFESQTCFKSIPKRPFRHKL